VHVVVLMSSGYARGKKVGSEESLNRETSPEKATAERAQRITFAAESTVGYREPCPKTFFFLKI
jgi:hypothetical protein